jgi:hypothetical protein
VYCASSNTVGPHFFDVAKDLGRRIAEQGWGLVYGGGNVGLMGALAVSAHAHGGTVCGVIPEFMVHEGRGYESCDEFIVTHGMRERKATMEERADAFVALPGGFGTLEELLEVLTLKQLGVHNKPIVVVNTNGFYDPLVALFDHFVAHQFSHCSPDSLYYLAEDAEETIAFLLKA